MARVTLCGSCRHWRPFEDGREVPKIFVGRGPVGQCGVEQRQAYIDMPSDALADPEGDTEEVVAYAALLTLATFGCVEGSAQ